VGWSTVGTEKVGVGRGFPGLGVALGSAGDSAVRVGGGGTEAVGAGRGFSGLGVSVGDGGGSVVRVGGGVEAVEDGSAVDVMEEGEGAAVG